jgi:AcrR family transcriptional regulator
VQGEQGYAGSQVMTAVAQKTSRKDGLASSKEKQILKVACKHFLAHGYDGSSITVMARNSGISKESIYRYFKSKDHLFMAVVDQELAQYRQKVRRMTKDPNGANLRGSLMGMAETLLGVLMPDRQQAVRRLVFNEIRRSPEIGRHYFKIGPSLAYGNLEEFFSSVPARTDFSPKVLSRNFVALVLHELMLERACGVRANPSGSEISELAGPIVDDFLKAYFKF